MGASISAQQRSLWTSLATLIAIFALAVYQLAQPPETLNPKVFVLGFSKTGTTSIGDALERLGYRRLGWRDVRSRHMVYTWAHDGDLTTLVEQTRNYDAFEDLPWPMVYKEMSELYPDAKFVLSLRKDEETWLKSMKRHMGRGEWLPYEWFYGATKFQGNEDIIRESYANHTRDVREYFKDKQDKYMEMSIDDGDVNWDVLCQIAQCPGGRVPSISFPKSNPASSWDMGTIQNAVRFCWGWSVTRTEEQVAKWYYERDVKALKPVFNALWRLYDFVERAYTELEFKIVAFFKPPLTAEQIEQVAHS
ncbi:hypothetical protein Slin15195_G020600 [Septoria linicola]|uniref:P-loop containing nucleoside triphosphate hydrolase protein n=1 Tax=Septoria linicola TaxID=215465 RepID=A0A9Q9AMM6_9PEZI|nr:hypothetical protein Slin15195_G020600 [Septoria linicola]